MLDIILEILQPFVQLAIMVGVIYLFVGDEKKAEGDVHEQKTNTAKQQTKQGIVKKLKNYVRRLYRLSRSPAKREAMVWADLKKYFKSSDLKHGVFEQDKVIETAFGMDDGNGVLFFYSARGAYFECFCRVITDYPAEQTSDLFILATHFNNVLNVSARRTTGQLIC